MTDERRAACPPHHWQVTSVHSDGAASYEHHLCLRCGARKDSPAPESPSLFWDRVDPPEHYARAGAAERAGARSRRSGG